MITHTSDAHQIQSQNKTKSKLQNLKNLKNFEILQTTLHVTHLLKLLDEMYKYEMDQSCKRYRADMGCGMDVPMDRQTDGVKPIYPPTTLLCVKGYNNHKSQISTGHRFHHINTFEQHE